MFQFLMVRLKVSLIIACCSASNAVSIPYGSIKSSYSIRMYGQHEVSIPYGSIKSLDREMPGLEAASFNSLWFD